MKQLDEIMLIPEVYDEESLAKVGFVGFRPIKECRRDYTVFPKVPAVYIIIRRTKTRPEYLTVGSGGHFKRRDPNVKTDKLSENWVDNANVVYIGMTTKTLYKRLSDYLDFGQGEDVGHWGGRYIWQLKDHEELLVCWKEMPIGSPEEYEKKLIFDFKMKYGERPFANLRD